MKNIKAIGSFFCKLLKLLTTHHFISLLVVGLLLFGIQQCVTNYCDGLPYRTLEKAYIILDNNNHESAKSMFSELILQYGDNKQIVSQSYSGRAYANMGLNKIEDARKDATNAMQHNAGNGDAYFVLGIIHSLEDEPDKAIAQFDEALNQTTRKKENVYLCRGIEFLKKIEHELALADFNKALKINPEHVEALLHRGFMYDKKGQLERMMKNLTMELGAQHSNLMRLNRYNYSSIEELSIAIQLNPEDDKLYYNRGVAYYMEDKIYLALEDFSKAIHLNQNNSDAYIGQFFVYMATGEIRLATETRYKAMDLISKTEHSAFFDLALNDYTKAIDINSDDVRLYNLRGTTYNNKEEYDSAIEDFSKAISLNVDSYNAYMGRSFAYLKKGENELAIKDFLIAISLDPIDYFTQDLSNTYGKKENYDLEIEYFSEVINLNPNDKAAYMDRGIIYGEQRKYDLAIEDFSKAIALVPDDYVAYMNRGVTYSRKRDYELALTDFSKAIRLNPSEYVIYFNRSAIYKDIEEYDLAIDDLSMAISLNPNDDKAYMMRGLVYSSKGSMNLALEDFFKATSLHSP